MRKTETDYFSVLSFCDMEMQLTSAPMNYEVKSISDLGLAKGQLG